MDFKKIIDGSKLPIVIAFVFNIALFAILYLTSSYLSKSLDSTIILILMLINYGLSYLGNFLIYAYTGYRSGKKFGATALEGALTTAFTFFVVCTIYTIISTLVTLVTFGSLFSNNTEASLPFFATMGIISLGTSLVYYSMTLVAGLIVNLVIGGLCAYWASRKWY
ncbi:Uncharacterised protein [Candidatus Bilamarchaeum dharawalense]|uniref:Uncharacterized protein n=1 Tax=Candidatus Bilamarchaeum dharawalense TaxID=2885759 RepID=A0A5E4LKI1_9ARCH|nr:Uncharacterised protein [Candidatus Bilamarchaeum dharawalense]